MASTIIKEQAFKGSINTVEFDREDVFDATAVIVNSIEEKWPITCSKDTVESIKQYVEGMEAVNPSFSFKRFEQENKNRIKHDTLEPKDLYITYERSDYMKEVGTVLPMTLKASIYKDQEQVVNFNEHYNEVKEEREKEKDQKIEEYQGLTEEQALRLVSSNGTELLFLPDKFRNNEKIVSAAITNNEDAFRYAGASARDNDRLARQAITADPDNIKYVGQTLRNDPDLYQIAIEHDKSLFKDIPVAMQKNELIKKIMEKDKRHQVGLTIKQAKEGAELTR